MILYKSSLDEFCNDVDNNQIVKIITDKFFSQLGYKPGKSEQTSWNNSLRFMETAVRKAGLPEDCGVLIEYKIPSTSRRIDFMVTGQNDKGKDNFVLVELKQWSEATKSEVSHLVNTYVGNAFRDVLHPSYQVLSYQRFLTDMNVEIQNRSIEGHSCAYLHNYERSNPEPLEDNEYSEFLESAPIFFQEDAQELQKYLQKHLSKGNGLNIQKYIERSRLRPSKKLIDAVASLFKGNEDFILLDDQIIAYETICYEARNKSRTKKVIIVEGGPGTGKSVVSLNVFNSLIADEKSINFVAPNAAFRNVIVEMLTKGKVGTKSYLSNLFKGSAGYVDKPNNYFDVIIVDEAHRLKKKGAFMYRGENQVEDIIKSSAVSVFFVDDKQRVRPDDVGGVASIMEAAFKYGAEIKKIHLTAQFRCSGAEGYVNWITDVLQIEETANSDGWEAQDFDFQILDSPKDVHNIIKQRNEEGHDARILAGYAWPWTSAKKGNPDAEVSDIVIAEHGFEIPWNSRKAREYWAILPEGINQAGCIHTSQGLEFDYVGVLFGRDIKYNTSTGEVYGDYSSYYDTTGKKGMKETPDQLTKYIKNIYKVLCSRGMKGCYIYICDPKLRSYMKSRLNSARMNSDYDYVDSLSAELESVAEKPSEYNLSDSKEID